jgi:glutamate-1-semialdehyde 2,1-aminomutase/spore coat polysaccharide biosynthesis protein SpsF
LHDPLVIDQVIRLRAMTGADYASNVDPPTWPDGLDCEVVTAKTLLIADAEATLPYDREHVTPFVRSNRFRFSSETLICPLPKLNKERWTLDNLQDLRFIEEVAKRLPSGKIPSYLDVLTVLDREPDLRKINGDHERNAGSIKKISPSKRERRFDRSQRFFERAVKAIPIASQTFSKSHLQFPPNAAPLFLTHGDGSRVFDVDGNEYVDLVNALLPNVLGYRDPDVDDAIRKQLNRGISLSLATPLETELAERLIKHIPSAEMVRFGKNGTDATSAAIRLARAATRRDRVLALGYHGWQDWYIGATTRRLGVPVAVSALTHLVAYGDPTAVEKALLAHPGEFAAVILEPAGGSEPPPGYLDAVKALTRKHGALLIFDEIITGFRWSLGGAQGRYGVTPDLSAFGKAMGNGMPISAVVGRADIMRLMEDIFFSGTFGGEALSLAAAIATIDKIERENVVDVIWKRGAELRKIIGKEIATAKIDDVFTITGCEPFLLLAFKDHPKASKEAIKTFLLRELIQMGLLINGSHNLSYAHTPADFDRIQLAYNHALPALRAALDSGDIERQLNNQVIVPVFALRPTPAA